MKNFVKDLLIFLKGTAIAVGSILAGAFLSPIASPFFAIIVSGAGFIVAGCYFAKKYIPSHYNHSKDSVVKARCFLENDKNMTESEVDSLIDSRVEKINTLLNTDSTEFKYSYDNMFELLENNDCIISNNESTKMLQLKKIIFETKMG